MIQKKEDAEGMVTKGTKGMVTKDTEGTEDTKVVRSRKMSRVTQTAE